MPWDCSEAALFLVRHDVVSTVTRPVNAAGTGPRENRCDCVHHRSLEDEPRRNRQIIGELFDERHHAWTNETIRLTRSWDAVLHYVM